MSPILVGIYGLILLFLLVLLGVHVGVALGLVGVMGSALVLGIDKAIPLIIQRMYFSNASGALITLPLFILMGLLAASGDIGRKLYDGLSVWTSKIKGGLGIATVLGCAAFGTVCGSSFVTATVFAKVSAPEMRKHGYDKKIAYGLCSSAGIIGMLIPPSVLAVVYGIISGLSIGKLLMAGIGPGILLTILFSLFIYVFASLRPDKIIPTKLEKKISLIEKIKVIPSFWPIFVIGIIVFGGIFSGIFSPTESAAIATVVVVVVLLIINPKNFWKDFKESLKETAITSGMIFITIGGASIFSQFLVITGLSHKVVKTITMSNLSNTNLIIVLSFIFLFLGTFMDSTSMLTIAIPLIAPIINSLGINPYYYAIIAIYAAQIGIITPPFGLSVFAVKGVAEKDLTIEDIFSGSMPFLIVMILTLFIMIFYPPIITIFIF